jgi:hypothetical protein
VRIVQNLGPELVSDNIVKRFDTLTLTMRVAKLAMDDMMPLMIPHASSEPCALLVWCTIGPIPFAFTSAHMKKATPAVGTKYAFTVNRWRILWTGNQIAGNEQNQNKKNDK